MDNFMAYGRLLVGLAVVAVISSFAGQLFDFFAKSHEASLLSVFFDISVICVLSFIVFYLTQKTVFPSFVVAIFFGMAAKPMLSGILGSKEALPALVGFGATLILFGGGLETPWVNFKKLFWKIMSLAFVGLLATASLFSFAVFYLGQLFGIDISITTAILLGAVLASTDPAAIIPVLKQLRFKNRDIKDIVVSESAVTDVTGTLLTVMFLGILTAGGKFLSVGQGYLGLASAEAMWVLGQQVLFGVVFGVLGYALLEFFVRFKHRHESEFEADAAYFLFVPVVIFTIALSLGGSGYLAAFITGLLFITTEKLHATEKFFNHAVDGFLKPMIFILLGALVELSKLFDYLWIGLAAAFLFMFVIRPIAVALSLAIFTWVSGRQKMTWRELGFIAFVRETGAIPAVLLVTIASLALVGTEGLLEIGMIVILATLIIEPPLTPWLAKKLSVADSIVTKDKEPITSNAAPLVVLATRGHAFARRLRFVADWSATHQIFKVVVLHCPEDKYSDHQVDRVKEEVVAIMGEYNKNKVAAGEPEVAFSCVSRQGLLQDNIELLAKEEANITTVFVGKAMLDYRLSEIKQLGLPFYFIS